MNSNILNSLQSSLPSYFFCSKSKKSGQSSSEFATLRFRVLHLLSWFLWVFVIFRNLDGKMNVLHTEDSIHIREVWNDNLEHEFALIRKIVDDFPFVAMDTEFPGVVIRPLQDSKTRNEYNFHTLKANVDITKLIQLGLTFSDKDGNLPTCGTGKFCVWQFNFREFNIDEDFYALDSIELLTRSGIDVKKFRKDGVDAIKFCELLIPSGVVLNDDMHWITFHSPYDFGYLLKLLTCKNLPDTPKEFFNLMKIFFPVHYDIKHLMKFSNNLHGGLKMLANRLGVKRIGTSHQAGSDSLLTSSAFRVLNHTLFKDVNVEKYAGVLFGLENLNE